jgi:hypothetical protein
MVLEHDRVLVISHDVVGERMAGPGIRYYQLARVLSHEFRTILAVPSKVSPDLVSEDFSVVQYARHEWDTVAAVVERAEIVILPGDMASDFPQLVQSDACLVVDGYDPLLIEWLTLQRSPNNELLHDSWWHRMRALNRQYLMGDFFLCASERQRDWWLGLLEANGRLNPDTFGADPSLRNLIDVVPYGLPESPPQPADPLLRKAWPEVGIEDKVILWGGGLWPWLDPLTAIRAVARIWQQRRDIRLIFPGTERPGLQDEGIPTHAESAWKLADSLGLLNEAVFFGDWVPYADWPSVLQESDIALTLHHDTLETRLAFRSRVMDYIWVGLPMIATRGDAISDLVAAHDLGAVVDYESVDEVAAEILHLLETPSANYESRFAEIRQEFTWRRVSEPLVRFCRNPRKAPDKGRPLGNPYYLERQRRLAEQRDHWREQVNKYQQGRFIRLMRMLHSFRERIRRL